MFARLPLAFAGHLDPGAVDQQVQTARVGPPDKVDLQRLLPSAQRRIIRHRPIQVRHFDQARYQPRHLPQGQVEQRLQSQAQLNRTVRNRIGRPGRPHGFDSQCISGSNHISSDPRRFSAALYSGQFVVRYRGVTGLGITPIYPARFPARIPNDSFATKPIDAFLPLLEYGQIDAARTAARYALEDE
jgi:hypothetical protein